MVACLSPADRFLEENASTLDYAARARKIANQVTVNEDPRSRLIRELRAEVAFLRQQLEAAGVATGAAALPAASARLFGSGGGATTRPAITGTTATAAAVAEPPPSATATAAAATTSAGGPAVFADEDEAAYANQLRSSDVEVLVRAVIEASRVALASSSALASLRAAYARTCASLESLRVEYDTLASDDAHVRDRLSMLEALVAADSRGGAAVRPIGQLTGDADRCGEAAGLYTASTAALIELEELRRENALLHERLQLLEPDIGPSGVVLTVKTRGSVGTMGLRPATGAAARGSAMGPSARSVNARGGGGVRPATSGASGIGSGSIGGETASVRHQQTQRAQSAGSRLPTRTGRLLATPLAGTGAAAAAAAAAAASNPFIPNDVLSAVLPLPLPTAAGGTGGVGRMGSGPRPHTSAGSGSSSSNKTLTVDQLRSVLQLNGGGGGGTGSGPSASRTDAGGDKCGTGTITSAASGGGGHRPHSSGALAGTNGNSSNTATATATGRLTELGHAVASRALASGVRLSTTGKLLPAAPARMAVEAATVSGASSPIRPGTSSATAPAAVATASKELSALAGSTSAVTGPPTGSPSADVSPEAALVHLMAERNALTRQRLAGGQ
ncbi:hypothetical protein Vretimale_7475 [Volvox reticuliferus]|uniref:Uncharacterized protein n=1 Tax=Volvox reticuliferus TaxID=1737510 RepID=A0A8J4FKN0_9CHLO|nr:hypothetical protein Vretifemale_7507 [Volvox reticuliferus]GIM02596.1 hypothetical protein Vretimale_7475 [Volvox reticuliferus]